MDKNEMPKFLETVQEEVQAIRQQNESKWIPPAFGALVSKSLVSIPSQDTNQGTDDILEAEFPYDTVEGANFRHVDDEDSSEEDADESSDEDADDSSDQDISEHLGDEDRDNDNEEDTQGEVFTENVWTTKLVELKKNSIGRLSGSLGNIHRVNNEARNPFVVEEKNSTHTRTTRKQNKGQSPGLAHTRKKKPKTGASQEIEMSSFPHFFIQERPAVSFHSNTSLTSSGSSILESNLLDVTDLEKLGDVTLDTITDCIQRRYKHDLVYTKCGDILISVNPLKPLEMCTYKYFKGYTEHHISEIPHLFAVSAKVYQDIREKPQDQVILVSGESGSGKTEATKLIVRHLMHISGSDYDTLPDRIIQINPLLETFGNAKTKHNNNSSRFNKLLTLSVNSDGKIISARVQDYMLEKSRVVHHGQRERTFHSFYSLLVGASDHLLKSLYLRREDKFRVTGDLTFMDRREKMLFRELFDLQQEVFKLIKFTEDEVNDVYTILAAILHLGNIEFEETDNDSVIIKDENVVVRVATLLKLDVVQLTKALIERIGRMGKDQKTLYEIKLPQRRSAQDLTSQFKTPSRGKLLDSDLLNTTWNFPYENTNSLTTGDIIQISKNKMQAEVERDATAMALYERLFGWLVRKINDSLRSYRNQANIQILDISGFENLDTNRFEQMCINLVNEQLHNFMNKMPFEKGTLYLQEGLDIGDVDIKGISNDALLHMFMEERSGILTRIDDDSKLETSTNEGLVSKLVAAYGNGGILVPSISSTNEFMIRHFAGEVAYDANSFIQTNRDNLSEAMKEVFIGSESLLIQDLFSIQEVDTGSISMAGYNFRGSNNPNPSILKTFPDNNLSWSINNSRNASLQQKFGDNFPTFQNGDLAQRNTQIKFFRNSLAELLNAMKSSHPHFVRCIKPNDLQLPDEFSKEKVKSQLQYNKVTEITRLKSFDFPVNLSKQRFIKLYKDLAKPGSKSDIFHDILQVSNADVSQYKIGTTQIFLKKSVKAALDYAVLEVRKMQEDSKKAAQRNEYEKRRRKRRDQQVKNVQQLKEELGAFTNSEPAIGLSAPPYPSVELTGPTLFQDGSIYNKLASSFDTNIIPETSEESDSSEENSIQSFPDEPEVEKSVAAWDISQELTEEEERIDVHEQPLLMAIKFFVYILLFVVILCAFVIQKVSFLLLTTGLKVKGPDDVTIPLPHRNKKRPPSHKEIQTVFLLLMIIAICIPYALGWLITVSKLCFGNYKRPSVITWVWVFLMETLHTIGLCVLVFRILPNLDVYRSVMLLSATAILPSVLKSTMSSSDFMTKRRLRLQCGFQGVCSKFVRNLLDLGVILAQISVIPLIICLPYFKDENNGKKLLDDQWYVLEIIGAFILVSCAHWENFTDGDLVVELEKKNWFKNAVLKIRFELQNGRHFPHAITYLWKIGLTVLLGYLLNEDVSFDYQDAMTILSRHKNSIGAKAISAVIALIISSCVAFYMSFAACMFQMQVISLAIPALLAVPVTFLVFYLNHNFEFLNFLESETEEKLIHSHLVFPGYSHDLLFGLAWWLSLVILSRHMWFPRVDRNTNMARLFVNQTYCGVLTSESIMLNRIRNPKKVRDYREVSSDGEIQIMYYRMERRLSEEKKDDDMKDKLPPPPPGDDTEVGLSELFSSSSGEDNPEIPMLYACATMWHETQTEMIQLLKSVHRLDMDQYIRGVANENVKGKGKGFNTDFYHFEAHIFIDDAMEPDDNDQSVPNSYVKQLVSCMDVACSSVHGKPMKVHHPIKVPTPYGGQLIWQMPGENLLFIHMKDIRKIRNRKRWSQVMYMYYLLGYRQIMTKKMEVLEKMQAKNAEGGYRGLNIHELNYLWGDKAAIEAQNTFILALDGDTDFSPGSIKILLDRMSNETVGAACGRIHPIGRGPMVWYQKFEYAIGHWLQKAAEHVFGCVMCSPGCFSLFRASALMDTNVMKRYTTNPTEPGHHLQFDQGEDRWLCTLLLQQGYRIDYAAAADAWTFAPEGFFEFFNQRRRWMPSTIANIIDLLGSADKTTRKNANMSKPYIAYQWLLMLMTVLGPGTIIMMIAGAVKLVFKFSLVEAYIFSTVPAAIFIVVCFWFKSRIQLIVAAILSIVYTFVMMVVLVGTIITATTESIFHPSVIVIAMLIGIFVISGLCHPQEIWCLVHGVMYLLTIPSGYLLMVIYSICNLNDVSWGTREVLTKAQRLELEKKAKEKAEQEKINPKKGLLAKIFYRGEANIRELTKLVKMMIPQRMQGAQDQMMGSAAVAASPGEELPSNTVVQLLAKIDRSLELMLKKDGGSGLNCDPLTSVVVEQPQANQQGLAAVSTLASSPQAPLLAQNVEATAELTTDGKKKKRKKPIDELKNPVWSKDRSLGSGKIITANKLEIQFWRDFVEKYLQPIRPSREEKKTISDGLRNLRNSSAFGLIVVNLLWMAMNFMFQLTNAARFTITYGSKGSNKIEESVLGLAFVFLLLLLLVIQMIGMFIHRMETFRQLLARTEIRICKGKERNTSNIEKDRDDIIRRIRAVLKLPLAHDSGTVTLPPTIAPISHRKLGVTVMRPSSRGIHGQDTGSNSVMKYIGQTLKENPMFGVAASSRLDLRTQGTTNSAKQRVLSNNTLHRLSLRQENEDFKPQLPPRRQTRSLHMQVNNLGFTQKQLRTAGISYIDDDSESAVVNLAGAMSRTLVQRTKAINEFSRNSKKINNCNIEVMFPKKHSITGDLSLHHKQARGFTQLLEGGVK